MPWKTFISRGASLSLPPVLGLDQGWIRTCVGDVKPISLMALMAKTRQEASTCQSRSGGGRAEGRLGDATKGWSPPRGSWCGCPSSQPGGAGQDLCRRIQGDAHAWRRERWMLMFGTFGCLCHCPGWPVLQD